MHGTPGSRVDTAPPELLDRLGIRLITYDRPGYGGSAPPREGMTIADGAGHVAAIADHLGIDTFAVVGRSGGTPYAAAAAALLPDRRPTDTVAQLGDFRRHGNQTRHLRMVIRTRKPHPLPHRPPPRPPAHNPHPHHTRPMDNPHRHMIQNSIPTTPIPPFTGIPGSRVVEKPVRARTEWREKHRIRGEVAAAEVAPPPH
ncbi:alpha/beta fold hydrolase [Nocardia sp. NPDC004718]